jgi:DNA-binding transcriptional ArsR family regulator
MVDYRETSLNSTFAALSDPTRRALLARLQNRTLSISELAQPLPISLQAVIKHLDVLADAGLVTRSKAGRTVTCSVAVEPLATATTWLEQYQRAWHQRLDRLDAYLQRMQQGKNDE